MSASPDFARLQQQAQTVRTQDYPKLLKRMQQLKQRLQRGQVGDRLLAEIDTLLTQSAAAVSARRERVPSLNYPSLPISDHRESLQALIEKHPVVVVAGETGSGKTTQLPKICLAAGRGARGLIGHTQPRRIAARSVADRIAHELGTELGALVGYQVRFTDQTSPDSLIKLMTDGILLAEIQRDPLLSAYDTLIIDEAHERSLNIDFLLGYLKQLLPKRPDLKLIITSATIDLKRFSAHFNDAPIVEVSGRSYPVEVIYRPLESSDEESDIAQAVSQTVADIMALDHGGDGDADILVFLSGEREIRETHLALKRSGLRGLDVLPLYARLSTTEQQRVFDLSQRRGRRVVLATNVAETSLTVPGIRYVIDSGEARISRYSVRTKVQRLPIEPISQASAEQRKGRCGRLGPGVCFRLYSEEDFLQRPAFTDPEILRTNLAAVILKMADLGLGDPLHFPFLEMPDRRQVQDGYRLLEELGAVDRRSRLTATGRQLALLPVDPRLGRMVLEADRLGALREVLVIVSALSVQDPRERPADQQQAADNRHQRYHDKDSDFMAFWNLWNYYEAQRQALSSSRLRQLCRDEFLHFLRLREWRDIHHQLRTAIKGLKLKENQQSANYESIHRALLAGLLSHLALQEEGPIYLGSRNRKVQIFPGSALFKKRPKWIMAAELVETSKLYARTVAKVEPEWVLGIQDSLLKFHYSEPSWSVSRGQVQADKRTTLFGLTLIERERIHYGPIDAQASRDIFLREGLVARQLRTRLPFWRHNLKALEAVEALEDKARRRDLLVEDEWLYQFYAERIPQEINTLRQLEHWYKHEQKQQPQLLQFSADQLLAQSAESVGEHSFPSLLEHQGVRFRLSYRFAPGDAADGLSLEVPIGLLNRVPLARLEWLVPGLLRDKCIALVKGLPKHLRKQLVPVPDHVDRVLATLEPGDYSLLRALERELKRHSGVLIEPADWNVEALEPLYRYNLRIVDERGRLLGQGRDGEALLAQFSGLLEQQLASHSEQQFQVREASEWNFGALPEQYRFKQAGVEITAYPVLKDQRDKVTLELADSAEEAERQTQQGMARLFLLQLGEAAKRAKGSLLSDNATALQCAAYKIDRNQLKEQVLLRATERCFLGDGQALPRSERAFEQRLQERREQWPALLADLEQIVRAILHEAGEVAKGCRSLKEFTFAPTVLDVQRQVGWLLHKGFVLALDEARLAMLPRYLQAARLRLERVRGHQPRDRQCQLLLEKLYEPLLRYWQGDERDLIGKIELQRYRWMLDELRVSMFAQELGTPEPVSEKRLKQQWHTAERAGEVPI